MQLIEAAGVKQSGPGTAAVDGGQTTAAGVGRTAGDPAAVIALDGDGGKQIEAKRRATGPAGQSGGQVGQGGQVGGVGVWGGRARTAGRKSGWCCAGRSGSRGRR